MSNTVLKIENISKQYRLGQLGTGTISHDINRWWHHVRGKEDPYLKVGDTNDRSKAGGSDYVWSLKDINFEVKQGDVLGIIGKNGAGKSTLLKILSQVTTPTTGQVKVKGRIAALLEVGTGFHPDLSGRENIFLNGAILGMTKSEIKSKLDEIVEFSGVAKYLDTPVKRYSSGMMVRLGFAVAAHLEPEILIIDEVLAVGDAEFQKKCLGKMKDVSEEGRTVLFVSHNMNAMVALCTKGIYLKNGKIKEVGDMSTVINSYLTEDTFSTSNKKWNEEDAPGNNYAKLLEARLINDKYESESFVMLGNQKYGIEFTYKILQPITNATPQIHVYSEAEDNLFISYGYYDYNQYYDSSETLSPGVYKSVVWFPASIFNTKFYKVGIGLSNIAQLHFWDKSLTFEVIENTANRKILYKGSIGGALRPELDWKNSKIS